MLDQMFRNMTPVVKNLLIINVLVFLAVNIAAIKGIDLGQYLYLYHYSVDAFQPYQFVTTMFFHTGLMHLAMNMLGLVSFGSNLERMIGPQKFLILYLASGLLGGLFYSGFHMVEMMMLGEDVFLNFGDQLANNDNLDKVQMIVKSRALGASGAVFGIFAAVYRYFPNTQVMLLFPPIPLKIKYLFLILMGGSLLLSIFPVAMQGIAHMAHFGGGLAGLLLVMFWKKDRDTFY